MQAIHRLADPAGPLLVANCAALPESQLESLLWGLPPGVLAAGERPQPGLLEMVQEGTLFLDEIGEMPMATQAKILPVIEGRTYRAPGDPVEKPFLGRVMAATHHDLEDQVRRGGFRQDLYHRINVLTILVPPLADHREDIPALVAHFAGLSGRQLQVTEDAMAILVSRPWPGNVRQLRNVVDRALVFVNDGQLTAAKLAELDGETALSFDALQTLVQVVLRAGAPAGTDLLAQLEGRLVSEALTRSHGNKSEAARLLGISRKAIRRVLAAKAMTGADVPVPLKT